MLPAIKYIICCYVLVSCSDTSSYKYNEAYYLLAENVLNTYAKPIIPPPHPNLPEANFQSVSDSIRENFRWKDALKVQLYTDNAVKIVSDYDFKVFNLDEYSNIYNTGVSYNSTLDIFKIEIKDKIKLYKSGINLASENWEGIDMKIHMSKVSFNEKLNKSAMLISVSRGKLSGFSILALAVKKEGEWIFVKEKMLEIS